MGFYPLISVVSMVAFAWLGNRMARTRNRNPVAWGLAGALFPPLLLALKFMAALPARAADDEDGEED